MATLLNCFERRYNTHPMSRLPEHLAKDGRPDIDPAKALRTIRILGGANLLLILALGGSLWWNSRSADSLKTVADVEIAASPVKVFMETRFTSNGKSVRDRDTVTDPLLTVYGVVSEYGLLREGLPDLSVTIRGTRVDINPGTGEFTERIVLQPGENVLDISLWWNGREQRRSSVKIEYKKDPSADAAITL